MDPAQPVTPAPAGSTATTPPGASPLPVPGSPAAPAPAPRPESAPRSAVLRPAIVYALLFGAQGAYLPYIALYLSSTGVGFGTVGALIALFAAVGLVAAPAWGALADGIGDVRGPVVVAGLLSGLAVLLLALAGGPLALAVAIALLAAAWGGVIPMIDSQTVRIVGHRVRFGRARGPGSAAFVVIAFATGAVLGLVGPRGMFVVFGPMVVLTGIGAFLLLGLPTIPGERRARRARGSGAAGRALAGLSPATILGVLRTPRLGLFFVASIVVWTSHNAFQGFLSLRIRDLGGDAGLVAATWSLGPVVEVGLMAAFPRLAARFGVERLIVLGGVAFAIRAALTSVLTVPAAIVLVSVFGGIGFSFFYVGTVSWVARSVGRGVQATAQGIVSGTANSVGAIGGSIIGGSIGSALGLPVLFGLAAAGYLAGAILVWLAIARGGGRVRRRND